MSTAGKLTEAQKADVLERYAMGENLTQIAACFNVTRPAIAGLLRRRGVAIRNNRKLTMDQRKAVVAQYVDGVPSRAIAEEFGVTEQTVRKTVGPARVSLRRAPRPVREDAFDVISEASAYWAGFLFADGHIAFRPGYAPQISVGLAVIDRDHLEKASRIPLLYAFNFGAKPQDSGVSVLGSLTSPRR